MHSALSNLYHFYHLYSARKYVEQFSNGITIISLYLNPLPDSQAPPIEHSIFQVMKEASLLFCLPDNPFFLHDGNENSGHAVQEATYACTCSLICLVTQTNHRTQIVGGSSRSTSVTVSALHTFRFATS